MVVENIPSPFHIYFEIATLGILLTVSTQTGVFFGERFLHKKAMMNLTGFLASILGFLYSVFELGYWFKGIGTIFTCSHISYVTAFLQGMLNAMAFVHLFLRANTTNVFNPKWRYFRIISLILIAANWSTVLGVIVDRTYDEYEGFDGVRCMIFPGTYILRVKYLVELLNHVAQAMFFVWPLWVHIKLLDSAVIGGLNSSSGSDLFRNMAKRAIAAMTFSVIVTAIVTSLVIYSQEEKLPTIALGILDSSAILGSIYFANCSDMSYRNSDRTPVSFQGKNSSCTEV